MTAGSQGVEDVLALGGGIVVVTGRNLPVAGREIGSVSESPRDRERARSSPERCLLGVPRSSSSFIVGPRRGGSARSRAPWTRGLVLRWKWPQRPGRSACRVVPSDAEGKGCHVWRGCGRGRVGAGLTATAPESSPQEPGHRIIGRLAPMPSERPSGPPDPAHEPAHMPVSAQCHPGATLCAEPARIAAQCHPGRRQVATTPQPGPGRPLAERGSLVESVLVGAYGLYWQFPLRFASCRASLRNPDPTSPSAAAAIAFGGMASSSPGKAAAPDSQSNAPPKNVPRSRTRPIPISRPSTSSTTNS